MALSLAHQKGTISESKFRTMLSELEAIPSKVQQVLEQMNKSNTSLRSIKMHRTRFTW